MRATARAPRSALQHTTAVVAAYMASPYFYHLENWSVVVAERTQCALVNCSFSGNNNKKGEASLNVALVLNRLLQHHI